MSGMELFWIFIALSTLQPLVKQRLLEASRQRLIAKLEKERGSRVILLVHRQETMSFLGLPIVRYIDIDDSENVLRAIHMTDADVPLDIVLHTPGGLVLAAMQIARAIAKHRAKVTVHVPHYAMSGGTLIALAADEISMSEHAVLGPVDPQVGEYPAASIVRAVERKPAKDVDDDTLIMADVSEKALAQLRTGVRDLLSRNMSAEKADEAALVLTSGVWTHDYAITPEEATKLGLKVRTDMPSDLFQLMGLFPQPVQRTPTVEYLPTPHHRPAAA
jgi:ClpP class serine protease